MGGFVGFLKDNTPSGQTYIEDCYSIGNAIATDGHELKNGGFIGAFRGWKGKNSYSYSYFLNEIDKSNTKPAASFVGLLMHWITEDDTAITGSYALDYGQNIFVGTGDKDDYTKVYYFPEKLVIQ